MFRSAPTGSSPERTDQRARDLTLKEIELFQAAPQLLLHLGLNRLHLAVLCSSLKTVRHQANRAICNGSQCL